MKTKWIIKNKDWSLNYNGRERWKSVLELEIAHNEPITLIPLFMMSKDVGLENDTIEKEYWLLPNSVILKHVRVKYGTQREKKSDHYILSRWVVLKLKIAHTE